ncbi:MAG TPA: SDR family oxidoreductase [Candidatus Sulfomarinibacteraceae bacterium]|nr:SDR family oxidoreductase [Candidatus Sulfomarinibacteraceae bacterium]
MTRLLLFATILFKVLKGFLRRFYKPFLAPMLALAGFKLLRRLTTKSVDLTDQVVLITGSSRGLGLLLAHAFAHEGCRIVICARDAAELDRAEAQLRQAGAMVLARPCDVSKQEEVEKLIDDVGRHFGQVDILVNNAGVMEVGPLESMTVKEFEEALAVMFWGILYPTLAVLPQMRARRAGRIVNITSIGGKASVPHLLPYNAAKGAAISFSEGLRAELAGQGITVTTIVPGLMRTGSYLNAIFRGRQAYEYGWFALSASLPLVTMNAERAAQQIVAATKRGEAERTLSLPAVILANLHGLLPGATARILGLAGRLVQPSAGGERGEGLKGMYVQELLPAPQRWIMRGATALGRRAAHRLNQYDSGPVRQSAFNEGRE